MKLSKTSSHAAIAVAFLADHATRTPAAGPIQARQIAEHLNIPTDSALKILQCLVRQRIIQSQLGRRGGYFLNHDPQQVTLLQIVEAIDGPIVGDVPLSPHLPGVQRLHTLCQHAADQLRSDLDLHTVADLAEPAGAPLAVAG